MNRITKVGVGAAIAAAALLTVAAPASAAPSTITKTDATTMSDGDRVRGKFILYTGTTNPNLSAATWIGYVSNPGGEPLTGFAPTRYGYLPNPGDTWESRNNLIAADDTFTFPAQGTTGPIVSDKTGACFSGGWLVTCDDTNPAQTFSIDANGVIRNGGTTFSAQYRGSTGGNWYTHSGLVPYSGTSVVSLRLDPSKLTPVAAEATPVDILGPTSGETVTTLTPTVDGIGEPGATIVIRDADGNEVGTGVVSDEGTWSIVTGELPFGDTTLTAEQTTTDGQTSSDTVNFVIVDPAQVPIADPLVAGGILTAIAAAAATVIIRRRTA